jgi:hypothetical protein
MAPTLRVHPTIKHQPNHEIRSHLPIPILTDSTIAIYSFHHQLLAAISLDLLLSHIEGVDCLLPIRAIRGVEWGDDVNHGHRRRCRPTVAYQRHTPTRHTSHGTTTGIVGGGKMYLMTTPKVEEGTSLVVSFEGAPWSLPDFDRTV